MKLPISKIEECVPGYAQAFVKALNNGGLVLKLKRGSDEHYENKVDNIELTLNPLMSAARYTFEFEGERVEFALSGGALKIDGVEVTPAAFYARFWDYAPAKEAGAILNG